MQNVKGIVKYCKKMRNVNVRVDNRKWRRRMSCNNRHKVFRDSMHIAEENKTDKKIMRKIIAQKRR